MLRSALPATTRARGFIWACVLLATVVVAILVWAPDAPAYEEPNDLGGSGCSYCHPGASFPDMYCDGCHGDDDDEEEPGNGYEQGNFQGPHGGYTTGTSKCANCHSVHDAPSAVVLLPEPTIVATCFSCHDGTGGNGVYGVIEARTGTAPAGGHTYEQTNLIPGGDGATGGSESRTFSGPGGTLICTDCHSPHGSETVAAFKGDRRRIRTDHPSITSTRLLKQEPTGATTSVAEYGSDWCAACHRGRTSGGMVMNHPVDSLSSTSTPFDYNNVAVLASDDPTSTTVLGGLGGIYGAADAHDWPADVDPPGNRGYLMPYPRTPQQEGHAPICQQCHEDARHVGTLVGDGSIADVEFADVWDADGVFWGGTTWTAGWEYDNPPFQNYPHETMNEDMLVEEYDDLCMNCHPVGQLP